MCCRFLAAHAIQALHPAGAFNTSVTVPPAQLPGEMRGLVNPGLQGLPCRGHPMSRRVLLLQEFMKAIMCFMVEFWDIERRPQPPIKPHSEPYIDFEWPLQGWCIDLPQVIPPIPHMHLARLP